MGKDDHYLHRLGLLGRERGMKLVTVEDGVVEHIVEAAGIYFRSIFLARTGMGVPQHVHDYDHATLVGSGSLRGWCDGEWIGDKGRGEAFEVLAGKKHIFESLEPNTLLICVHDIGSATSIKQRGL